MFWMKKTITIFLMPLPVALLFCAAGLVLLWVTQRQRWGKILTSIGVGILLLASFEPLANMLLRPIETTYPRYRHDTARPVRFIEVLGGGHGTDSLLPLSSQINPESLNRLIEGIVIYRKNPGSKLILTGYGGLDPTPTAVMMASVAQALGVPDTDMIVEPKPRDTHDEAMFVKTVVGDSVLVLVTSASHLKRAMALFRGQGLDPLPAPTYFVAKKSRIPNLKPSSMAIRKTEIALHEFWGLVWASLRGFTKDTSPKGS